MKIVVFFSGTGTNLESILKEQKNYGYEVVSAFTNNPDAKGIQICKEYKTECKIIDHRNFISREDFDKNISNFLNQINPDYIILAGYMRIISESLVNDWEGQIINIHPSLLPKYPGLDTHKKVLEAKDKLHGTTIHYVTDKLDAGPIIRQESFEIEPNDTVDSLTNKVKEIENRSYPEIIGWLKMRKEEQERNLRKEEQEREF